MSATSRADDPTPRAGSAADAPTEAICHTTNASDPAPTPANDASVPSPPGPGNAVAGDSELLSALAEIGDSAGTSLDGPAPHGGHGAAPAAPKKDRFKLGKKSAAASPESAAPPSAPAPTPIESPSDDPGIPVVPRVTLVRLLFRSLDAALELLHRPFAWLPARQRSLLGHLALATTLVCGIFALVQPHLLPHRDALDFLADKLAAANKPEPPAGDAHAAADAAHGEPAKAPDKKAGDAAAKPPKSNPAEKAAGKPH